MGGHNVYQGDGGEDSVEQDEEVDAARSEYACLLEASLC